MVAKAVFTNIKIEKKIIVISNLTRKFWLKFMIPNFSVQYILNVLNMDRVKRIWFLSPMRAAKVQASLRIGAVSPEPSLLAHTSSESRGTFRQKARSLPPLNGWACAVKIRQDGMLEDTNSLDGAHMLEQKWNFACEDIKLHVPSILTRLHCYVR